MSSFQPSAAPKYLSSKSAEPQLREQVIEDAYCFVKTCQEIDHALKRSGLTIPTEENKSQLCSVFWQLMANIKSYNQQCSAVAVKATAQQCRAIVGPWLFRSRFFNRSYYKPHGYAGDYRVIEWAYDSERDCGEDPTEPGIVNCLEFLSSTVHSVQSLWERRQWLFSLLADEYDRKNGRLRILDVACGGARYLKNFLSSIEDSSMIDITLVDQDQAALAFCHTHSLRPWNAQVKRIHTPIIDFTRRVTDEQFDVIISAGLFDYLNDSLGRMLLEHMMTLTKRGGVIAISNFHPDDPSRLVKEWLVDWWLVFRDEYEVPQLFPIPSNVTSVLSPNKALVLATTRI